MVDFKMHAHIRYLEGRLDVLSPLLVVAITFLDHSMGELEQQALLGRHAMSCLINV